MVQETWVQSQVSQRFLKWCFIPPCLTLSNKRHASRAKCSHPRKGEVPSPTRSCCSYWKESLLIALDYGRQLYLIPKCSTMVRVFANGPGDLGSIPGRVTPKSQKMILDVTLLNTQHYKVQIKGKMVQSQLESHQRVKKWNLMSPCLILNIIRYRSRVKWSNPGKEVASSSTPWFISYRKGRLAVTFDYGRQLYLLY